MRYKIKPMSADDFVEVLQLWRNTKGVGLNESDTQPALAEYLERNPQMSFVARNGREIVGAVLCGHDGRRGCLHHLAVAEAHRNQGVGGRLVRACLSELRRFGILKCNIFIFADNTDGERFWLNNGWRKRADIQLLQKPVLPLKINRCC